MELRALVQALRPKALYPCTVEPDLDMTALFGDLLKDFEPSVSTAVNIAKATVENTSPDSSPVQSVSSSEWRKSQHAPPKNPPKTQKKDLPPPLKKRVLESEHEQSLRRRQRAFAAAMGRDGLTWDSDVALISVSGYHNQEKELEL